MDKINSYTNIEYLSKNTLESRLGEEYKPEI